MPTTILCLASFFKGEELLRECRRLGARTVLVAAESLRDQPWPSEAIDRVHYMPDLFHREHLRNAVSWLAREEPIARIVPLDEFDLEIAAMLREHLRLPGLGESAMRFFRDKLAMRMGAAEAGIAVPEFTGVFQHERLREYMDRVPAPWVLKPRDSASAIGIRVIHHPDQLWGALDELGDRQSHHLLERFVPGDVFHVDSVVWKGEVVFAEAHGYVSPPFEVYHGGGLFCTRTLPREGELSRALLERNAALVRALGMTSGVLHTEFIRAHDGGELFFLETAARVGGAHIADLVEHATGVNLWGEWGRLEVALARGEEYAPPAQRHDYGGLLLCLARQEWPDSSAYADPEVVERLSKHHHAGLILTSPDATRVHSLLDEYMPRFRDDFQASMPALDSPNH